MANRHSQQAGRKMERYRPHESGQQAQITDTANRHSQKTERGRPIWGGPSVLSERRYQKRAALDWSVCW